jgi:hypothetical protein
LISNWLILLVPGARIELARGVAPRDFKSIYEIQAISHHFQVLIYQLLTRVKLEYVGLRWVILGFDGYKMVTVPPLGGYGVSVLHICPVANSPLKRGFLKGGLDRCHAARISDITGR